MKQGTPGEVTIAGANICCGATWYQASVTWQIGVAVIEASRCSATALEAGGKEKKKCKNMIFVCEYCSAICEIFTVDGGLGFASSEKKHHITVLIHKQEFFLLHTKKFCPFPVRELALVHRTAQLYLFFKRFNNTRLPALLDFSKSYLVFMQLPRSSQRSRSTLEVQDTGIWLRLVFQVSSQHLSWSESCHVGFLCPTAQLPSGTAVWASAKGGDKSMKWSAIHMGHTHFHIHIRIFVLKGTVHPFADWGPGDIF